MESHQASEIAAHKAKSAQAAVELAREVQLAEAIAKTAAETKQALLEGLQEVFGEGDEKDPSRMVVLVRRIPILCTNITQMQTDIASINDNQKWAVRIIIGAVILALLKLVLIP